MHHAEGSFQDARDVRLFYQAWLPEGGARAVLLIVHGIGEHSGRYADLAGRLVGRGHAVYGFDLPGHGRSDGGREVVERFEDYTDALAVFRALVGDLQPVRPLFLLAHSMGGLIACLHLPDRPSGLSGAILSAPGIRLGKGIPPVAAAIARILSLVAPRMGVAALDAGLVSRDPAVVAAYRRDPLVFQGKTPARLAAETMRAMRRVAREVHRITLPLLVLQGSGDRMVDPAGATMLFERAGSPDKTLKVYEGLWHELLNEPERESVIRDVEDWLSARV